MAGDLPSGLAMRDRPWLKAGVTRARWEQAHAAVIGLIADRVWRARGRTRSNRRPAGLDEPLDRLTGIGRGDRDATRYGLDLVDAQSDDQDD
jgi:hypothetical protein